MNFTIMKKYFLFFILFSIFCHCVFAQINIEWKKCYGGSGDDGGAHMAITDDGGYIIAGYTWSCNGDITSNHGWGDYWIVKIDSVGIIQWQKTIGGTEHDRATSVMQTTDGGYIVSGESDSNDGDVYGHHGIPGNHKADFWVVKLNASGVVIWQKSLGGTDDDVANAIIQSSDGGYVVVGGGKSTDGDISSNNGTKKLWVVKLDSIGSIQWDTSLNGYANSVIQITNGGYAIGGYLNDDLLLVIMDSLGGVLWQETYGGSSWEQPGEIIQTNDKGFLIAGDSHSNDGDVTGNHGGQDFWVVKTDSIGNIIWQKSYGGSNGDNAWALSQTSDGDYIVAGITSSSDGDVTTTNYGSYDYWIIKIDTIGNIKWQKSLGGSDSDSPFSVLEANNHSYIIAGESKSFNGDVIGNHGNRDYWIVKLSDITGIRQIKKEYVQVFPNPTQDKLYIKTIESISSKLEIYNMQCELIINKKLTGEQCIDFSRFAIGVYIIRVINDNGVFIEKIIKE